MKSVLLPLSVLLLLTACGQNKKEAQAVKAQAVTLCENSEHRIDSVKVAYTCTSTLDRNRLYLNFYRNEDNNCGPSVHATLFDNNDKIIADSTMAVSNPGAEVSAPLEHVIMAANGPEAVDNYMEIELSMFEVPVSAKFGRFVIDVFGDEVTRFADYNCRTSDAETHIARLTPILERVERDINTNKNRAETLKQQAASAVLDAGLSFNPGPKLLEAVNNYIAAEQAGKRAADLLFSYIELDLAKDSYARFGVDFRQRRDELVSSVVRDMTGEIRAVGEDLHAGLSDILTSASDTLAANPSVGAGLDALSSTASWLRRVTGLDSDANNVNGSGLSPEVE